VDLYEYQGKELFRRFGIPTSEGRLASTPAEARAAAEELGGQVVVKAQVLTGGRGKAGGVKLADDPDDAERKAEEIIGLDINGHVVRKLWIEQASEIAKEYYLSVTFDRGTKQSLYMLTTEGGVEIEEVAEKNPDALARLHVDPFEGYQPYQARRLIYFPVRAFNTAAMAAPRMLASSVARFSLAIASARAPPILGCVASQAADAASKALPAERHSHKTPVAISAALSREGA